MRAACRSVSLQSAAMGTPVGQSASAGRQIAVRKARKLRRREPRVRQGPRPATHELAQGCALACSDDAIAAPARDAATERRKRSVDLGQYGKEPFGGVVSRKPPRAPDFVAAEP